MKAVMGRGRLAAWVGIAWLAAGAGGAHAVIYTCVDANGKKLTSDRPIPTCSDREQRVLNADGSVKRIVPPTLTADERAEQEQRERQAEADRATQQDAIRKDRNLMARFPSETAHRKAREQALDDLRKLWAGAPAGSLPADPAASDPKKTAATPTSASTTR